MLVDSADEILPSSPKEYKGSSLTDEEYNLVHAWIYEQVRKSGVATKKRSVGRPRKFEKSFSANSVCFFLCNHPKIHEKLSIGTVRQWVAEYVAGASLKRSQQRKHKGGACPRSLGEPFLAKLKHCLEDLCDVHEEVGVSTCRSAASRVLRRQT